MPRLFRIVAFAMISLGLLAVTSGAPQAQERGAGEFSLNAMVGGALPYSVGGGYVVTRLISPDAEARLIDFSRGSPFGAGPKDVFDARPQVGLGGRYELPSRRGGAKLALKAMVSAGMERPDGERPILGLAGVVLVF